MKHKFLIDTMSLVSHVGGIGRYTYENAKRLKQFDDTIEWFYYYGYFSTRLACLEEKNHSNSKSIKALLLKNSFFKKIARRVLKLLTKLSRRTFDIYWQPNYFPESSIKAKHVVASVHDFSIYKDDNWHPKERIAFFKAQFPNVKNADKIITGSHYTKNEIVHYLDIPEDKIEVIYHGVNHDIFKRYQASELEKVRQAYNLPQKLILFVGSIEPRKNLISLIQAYRLLDTKMKSEYKLLFVGGNGWNNIAIKQAMQRAGVMHIENVDDITLASIYNAASLFVYPSWYEGFGIPPLEAFACGVPVVSSDASSLPEVCGDAALYFSPDDIEGIAAQMTKVLQDQILQQKMIKKGLKRAKMFTWKRAADAHGKLFNKLLT